MNLHELTAALLVAASAPAVVAQDAAPPRPLTLLVGTYTDTPSPDGRPCGVYAFAFDALSLRAAPTDTLALSNPSFLALAPDGRRAYAVCEDDGDRAALAEIEVGPLSGGGASLRLVRTRATGADGPCHVSTDGRAALVSCYGGGALEVFPIGPDGLGERAQEFRGAAGAQGCGPRQEMAHVHCAIFTPDGYALAADFSSDRLMRFRVGAGGALERMDDIGGVGPGFGPRQLAMSPDGRHLYVMSEMGDAVTVFRWRRGRARKVQEVKAYDSAGGGGADIRLTPDGRHAYASLRLVDDGVAHFRVDGAAGTLERVGYHPTARHPRALCVSPDGRLLLCCSRDDDKVQIFKIDERTGRLSDTGSEIRVPRPVCAAFVP